MWRKNQIKLRNYQSSDFVTVKVLAPRAGLKAVEFTLWRKQDFLGLNLNQIREQF